MVSNHWDEAAAELLAAKDSPLGAPEAWLGALLDGPIAATLDHTLLKPEATRRDIERLAVEGQMFGTATVCVNGCWVAPARRDLMLALAASAGEATHTIRKVGVAAVIGFPLGAMHPEAKADEARRAIDDGATELDMVQSIGLARSDEWTGVYDDVRAVVEAAGNVPVKVILETAALAPYAIAATSLIAASAGAAFVKTSTGFHAGGGATIEAVSLMRRAVGMQVGVKASGGVRTLEQALTMIRAGANRIGTSGAPAIVSGAAGAPLRALLAAMGDRSSARSAGGYG